MKLTKISNIGSQCQIAVTGDLRHAPTSLTDPLRPLLGALTPRRVLLNLEAVTSLDSSGIRWLLATREAIQQARGELILLAVPPCVAGPLRLLSLLSGFTTVENAKAAKSLPNCKDVA